MAHRLVFQLVRHWVKNSGHQLADQSDHSMERLSAPMMVHWSAQWLVRSKELQLGQHSGRSWAFELAQQSADSFLQVQEVISLVSQSAFASERPWDRQKEFLSVLRSVPKSERRLAHPLAFQSVRHWVKNLEHRLVDQSDLSMERLWALMMVHW